MEFYNDRPWEPKAEEQDTDASEKFSGIIEENESEQITENTDTNSSFVNNNLQNGYDNTEKAEENKG